MTLQFFATFAAVGLAALALGLLLYLIMAGAGADAARPFSLRLVSYMSFLVGMWFGGSYWILLSLANRMWRPSGLLWAIFCLVLLNYNTRDFARVILLLAGSPGVLALPDGMQGLLEYGLIALSGCYLWLVPVSLLRGAWALLFASREQCAAMRETPSARRFPRNAVNTLLGLPPLADFARKPFARYLKVIALGSAAGLFMAGAGLGAVGAMIFLLDAYVVSVQHFPDLVWPLVVLPFALAGTLMLFASIGGAIERAELGQVRFSLADLQRVDLRAPVLFLRAFADDQVRLLRPKLSYLGRALDFGRRSASLDEMLLNEATPYGPLVALGNPADARPPYGAARGYFDNRTWHQAVEDLVRSSSIIILCVDATDGVWWEVEHLALTRQFAKTLFLVHPSHRAATANYRLLKQLASILGASGAWAETLADSIPGAAHQTVLGFFLDRDGAPQILRSGTFSEFAYLLAIRIFIRTNLGMPGEPAASPGLPVPGTKTRRSS